MVRSRLRKSKLAPAIVGTAAILIACTATASAQNTGSATIDFDYSGTDITGEGGSSSGSGNFTVATNSNPTNNLNNLSAFNFSQTTQVPDLGTSSFSYNLNNLNNFSLSFPNGTPTVSLSTGLESPTSFAINPGNPNCFSNCVFYPESFFVSANSAGTTSEYSVPLQSGTIELENYTVKAALIANAVHVSTEGPVSRTGQDTAISATFTPNYKVSLDQLAAIAGYVGFDWVQKFQWPTPGLYSALNPTVPLPTSPAVINDPPPGGYAYQYPPNLAYPFYYDAHAGATGPLSLNANETNDTLSFYDSPMNSDLEPGQAAYFTTELVGILPSGTPGPALYEFKWDSNYDPTSFVGGVSVTEAPNVYAGEFSSQGTGGDTILSQQYLLGSQAAVPEATTWMLLLCGFAGLACAGYRTQRARRPPIAG
jgi:hypothetical protein